MVFSPLRSRRGDPVHQPAPDAAAPHKKNVVVWPPLPSPLLLLALPPCSPAAVAAADWLRAGSCSAGFFLPFSVFFPFFLSSPPTQRFSLRPSQRVSFTSDIYTVSSSQQESFPPPRRGVDTGVRIMMPRAPFISDKSYCACALTAAIQSLSPGGGGAAREAAVDASTSPVRAP